MSTLCPKEIANAALEAIKDVEKVHLVCEDGANRGDRFYDLEYFDTEGISHYELINKFTLLKYQIAGNYCVGRSWEVKDCARDNSKKIDRMVNLCEMAIKDIQYSSCGCC